MDGTETYFKAWSEVNRLRIGFRAGFFTVIEISAQPCGTELVLAMCW